MSSLSFELCPPRLFFLIVLLLFPLFSAFIAPYFAFFLLHVLPVFYTVIILPIIIIIIYVSRGKMLVETKIENADTNLDRFVLQDTSWIVRCVEK
jgi:hypothetical protein